jgi:hypothetical protein
MIGEGPSSTMHFLGISFQHPQATLFKTTIRSGLERAPAAIPEFERIGCSGFKHSRFN